MRAAFSTTRAPILISRSLRVANPARASRAGGRHGVAQGQHQPAGAGTGVSSWKIRQQTGHASDAMLARYIRDGEMFVDNAAGALL